MFFFVGPFYGTMSCHTLWRSRKHSDPSEDDVLECSSPPPAPSDPGAVKCGLSSSLRLSEIGRKSNPLLLRAGESCQITAAVFVFSPPKLHVQHHR